MVTIPPGWNNLTTIKNAGFKATLEPVQSFRVVDADEVLINKVRAVELDLLNELQKICERNNITIFAMYGTLLGTVRHGTIIPGDDDIDVALLRPDYDRLIALKHEFSGKYFLQTPDAENFFCGGYSKLRNVESTAISPDNWYVDCCEGIAIDIFPIDNCSKSRRKEKKRQRKILFYQRMLYAYSYGYFKDFLDMKIFKWKGYKYLGKLTARQKILEKFETVLKSGDKDSDEFCCYTHYTPEFFKKGFKKEYFSSFEKIPFANQTISVPVGYDALLEQRYGRYLDYSVYPDIRKYRHAFYMADVSYSFYKPKFRDCCRPVPVDKKLVLVGDCVMLSEFYARWGKKYTPSFFVEVDKIGWDVPSGMKNIQQISYDEFIRQSKEDFYIVICSIHIRETEKKLKDSGCSDYYIFIRKREWLLLSNPDIVVIEERIKNEEK